MIFGQGPSGATASPYFRLSNSFTSIQLSGANFRYIVRCQGYKGDGQIMIDVTKWKVRGPVATLTTEHSTWDIASEKWQPARGLVTTA